MGYKNLSTLADQFYLGVVRLAHETISPEEAQKTLQELDELEQSEEEFRLLDVTEGDKKDLDILIRRLIQSMRSKTSPQEVSQNFQKILDFYHQFKPEQFSEEFSSIFFGEKIGESFETTFIDWAERLKSKSEFDSSDLKTMQSLANTLEILLEGGFDV